MRVQGFTMAKIKHCVDPEDKKHDRFQDVRDVSLALLDRYVQASGSTEIKHMTIGDAVSKGVIANETFGYFF